MKKEFIDKELREEFSAIDRFVLQQREGWAWVGEVICVGAVFLFFLSPFIMLMGYFLWEVYLFLKEVL